MKSSLLSISITSFAEVIIKGIASVPKNERLDLSCSGEIRYKLPFTKKVSGE